MPIGLVAWARLNIVLQSIVNARLASELEIMLSSPIFCPPRLSL